MLLLLDILAQVPQPESEPIHTDILLELLNSIPVLGWGSAIFAALATAAALTGNLSSIIDFFRNYLLSKPREITEEQQQHLRQQLLSVLSRDVSKRLEDSLHNLVRIDIEREEQRQRVGRSNLPLVEEDDSSQTRERLVNMPGRRIFQPVGLEREPEKLNEAAPTLELFNRSSIQGRLLILGEPGSGKTTELLGLAQDLISQAQEKPDSPIPIIYEATNWKDGLPFEDWLVVQLEVQYRLPKQVAQAWIETNQLLPLIDGLDELGLSGQVECIEAINEYLARHQASPMVVCCRREEYEQGEALLDQLSGAIYLQPVTDEQIQQYFKDLNRERLWTIIQADEEIRELARFPLFLAMLAVAYQGQPIHRTQELLDVYIDKQLGDLNNQGAYPPGKAPSQHQTEHYLGWLAIKLDAQGMTELLIERLQPSWMHRSIDRSLYRFSFGLIIGLIFWLFGGLIFALFFGLIFGLFFGLIFGLFGGLGVGFFVGVSNIEPAEKLVFSCIEGLIFGLICALFFGLIFGLSGGLTSGLSVGLSVGLIFGLNGGLIGIESQIDDRRLPNQGIKRSLRAAIITAPTFGLSVGLIIGLIGWLIGWLTGDLADELIFGLIGWLIIGLTTGLIGGLVSGGSVGLRPAIQHFCLRFVLYCSGTAPWNYERFLKHAENHRFIQRVGGRYRFMHDLLRKRFAERYLE